jgi:hypothetical protein
MLETDAFDADAAAMLRRLYAQVCAQFVSLAPDEPKMKEVIATASSASPGTASAIPIASYATHASRQPS